MIPLKTGSLYLVDILFPPKHRLYSLQREGPIGIRQTGKLDRGSSPGCHLLEVIFLSWKIKFNRRNLIVDKRGTEPASVVLPTTLLCEEGVCRLGQAVVYVLGEHGSSERTGDDDDVEC